MKQIPILNGRCLVVELPEHADRTVAYGLQSDPPYINWMGDDGNLVEIKLPPGNWRIIGMLSELTEEELNGLIEPVKVFDYDAHYLNYKDKEYQPIRVDESLESAILAEGYTFDQQNPNNFKYSKGDGVWFDRDGFDEAQSRVLCRERCLLLGREV